MKYLLAFLVLSIIIIVHEFGHYIVAKTSGVKVVEFSLGMGPRLFKFTKNGTMYSLKLFLFGGSCMMLGEDGESDEEGSFAKASLWKRIAIIAAGPLFNFILAFVCAIIFIGMAGYDPVILGSVTKNSPAYEAGLREGDRITGVNGKNMVFYGDYTLYMYDHDGSTLDIEYERNGKKYNTTVVPEHVKGEFYQLGVYFNAEDTTIVRVSEDSPAYSAGLLAEDVILSIDGTSVEEYEDISPLIQASGGNEITLVVSREGKNVEIKMVPQTVTKDYYNYGFYLSGERIKCSPAGTVKYAFKDVGYWIKAVFKSLKLLVTGNVSMDDVSGPVGIVSAIGDVVEESKSDGVLYVFLNIINWCIMLSANLGIMNLLPLPALDGGRLVFLGIEGIRKKPVPKEKEGMVHFVGIVLLMILMVVVLFNDVSKLFR